MTRRAARRPAASLPATHRRAGCPPAPLRADRMVRSWDRLLRQLLAQLRQGIAVAGCGRVGRDAQGRRDLRERQAAPDLHYHHFALAFLQGAQRGRDGSAALALLARAIEERFALRAGRDPLPTGLSTPAALPVKSAVLHAGEEVCGRVRRPVP